MRLTALALLAVAAFAHAGWNLLAKRADAAGTPFVWAFAVVGATLWAPLGLGAMLLGAGRLDAGAIRLVGVSGALHAAYFVGLQRGYRDGDLSLVYPLARALGPLLAVPVAALALGQRPGQFDIIGGLLIVAAVASLAGRPSPGDRPALAYAGLTGLCIAAYTVWDAFAITSLSIAPVTYFWAAEVTRALLLTPVALRQPARTAEILRGRAQLIIGVAVLSPLAYVLVLQALRLAPVSVVAPAREMSIVLGALLGTHLLGEPGGRRRIVAAIVVVLGIAMLAA